MPELPEVETVKRVLSTQLTGQKIKNIKINNAQVIAHPSADDFCGRLHEQVIEDFQRRGKYIIIGLESGDRLIVHLRMTGCLLVTPADYPCEKHTHVILSFENGSELRFEDTRRFGRFWLIGKNEEDTYSGISKLGIEPFDKVLTAEYLMTSFGKRKKAIKECLLEQSVICGIGNIYSDEILFAAKIHPERSAASLTLEEWERLSKAIPEQLTYFIEKNIITPEEYLLTKGKEYRNTPYLRVYGHSGEPCPNCATLLQKSVVGGRSSVYCVECQPK